MIYSLLYRKEMFNMKSCDEKLNFQEEKALYRRKMKIMEKIFILIRILLLPLFLLVRVYFWVWDYNYYTRVKHPELMKWD